MRYYCHSRGWMDATTTWKNKGHMQRIKLNEINALSINQVAQQQNSLWCPHSECNKSINQSIFMEVWWWDESSASHFSRSGTSPSDQTTIQCGRMTWVIRPVTQLQNACMHYSPVDAVMSHLVDVEKRKWELLLRWEFVYTWRAVNVVSSMIHGVNPRIWGGGKQSMMVLIDTRIVQRVIWPHARRWVRVMN